MNPKSRPYRTEADRRGVPTYGTLDVRLNVNIHDPRIEVTRLFALAKSAGKELNITFELDTA
jgi:hypothetical protein